ncbi:bacterial regulatory helix-turn-helix, lysR family protein, partial [Vibrio harveyi]|jgi:hypothetical protein
MVGI